MGTGTPQTIRIKCMLATLPLVVRINSIFPLRQNPEVATTVFNTEVAACKIQTRAMEGTILSRQGIIRISSLCKWEVAREEMPTKCKVHRWKCMTDIMFTDLVKTDYSPMSTTVSLLVFLQAKGSSLSLVFHQ